MAITLQAPTNNITDYAATLDFIGDKKNGKPLIYGAEAHLWQNGAVVSTTQIDGPQAYSLFQDHLAGKDINQSLQIQTSDGKVYGMAAQAPQAAPEKELDPIAQAAKLMQGTGITQSASKETGEKDFAEIAKAMQNQGIPSLADAGADFKKSQNIGDATVDNTRSV